MASFREALLGKRFICCALTIVYSIIYNTVGRSIADIYDPRRHIYQGAKRRGKYAAEVVYIYIEGMDQPTVIYIPYTMVSVQQTNLLPKSASRNDAIFAQNVYRIYANTS